MRGLTGRWRGLERRYRRPITLFTVELLLLVFFLVYMSTGAILPCVFREGFGVLCAGCGMSRASYALFSGDFLTAVRQNIFIVPFTLIMVYYNFSHLLLLLKHKELPMPRSRVLIVVAVVLVLLYMVLRNLPMAPFSSLAPF